MPSNDLALADLLQIVSYVVVIAAMLRTPDAYRLTKTHSAKP